MRNDYSIAQWTQLNSGSTNFLYSVFFVNQDTGYVCGVAGTILKTVNGGVTWDQQNGGTSATLFQVFFVEDNKGVIVGDSGIILKTTDGGQTWVKKNSGTSEALASVYFTSISSGIAVGANATMLKTNDGGVSWSRLTPILLYGDTTYDLLSVHFAGPSVGYAGGGQTPFTQASAIILKTVDGGNTWSKVYQNVNSNPFYIYSLFPVNDHRVWSFGYTYPNDYYPKFVYTNDGGISFTILCGAPLCYSPNSLGDGIYFTNLSTGYLASRGGILYTIDGGISWVTDYSFPSGVDFDGIYFVNESLGYMVGTQGTIMKTINGGGIVGINEIPSGEKLNIFPNPSYGKFYISGNEIVDFKTNVRAIVYNYTGEIIPPLEVSFTNENNLLINISNCPEGLYYVKLQYFNSSSHNQETIFKGIINLK